MKWGARLTLRWCVVALCFAVFALAGCQQTDDVSGRYVAQAQSGEVLLVLDEGGRGTWATDEEDIAFTWERRGDEVWLHTRGGGVLVGTLSAGGGIVMQMPGVGEVVFSRERP